MLCAGHSGFSGSIKGYDALGYLTYTAWDASGIPRGKNVMLFVVKIKGDKWLIHTEPVNEAKGAISYFEGGGATDSVFMVSVCQGAPVPAEPRLRALRAELQLTKKDDVFFQNRPLPMPAALSNLLHHSGSAANSTGAKIVENNAVARALEGKYPAVDASYVAFLWFAFTPPSPEARGEDPMLLQTWDDGHLVEHRFRLATWRQFSEPPHLASWVLYQWAGMELPPSGRWIEIDTSDVSQPARAAARYDVSATTNLEDEVLPRQFALKRYATWHPQNEDPKVVSTIQASVVSVSRLAPSEPLEVKLPPRTFVSDYRLSSKELRGNPLRYMLSSSPPPDLKDLKAKSIYKHAAGAVHASAVEHSRARWAVLVSLLALPLVFFFLFRRLGPS